MKRLTGIVLALGLLLGMAGGPMAQPTHAASLKICGEVTVYVKATALATGLLTINGIPLVIALGVSLPASVAVGADLCVDLSTNVLGLISGGAVTANVHTSVKVCGQVTAHVAATSTATGLLKIGTHTFTLALGSHLPASIDVGDDICIDLDIDAFGRVADGTVTANAHVRLEVCGEVTAYVKATSTATGILKIGSKTWTLAVLSQLPASVEVGADICIELEIDGYGRVSDGEVSANVETTVKICGTVTAYTEATASALGQLRIAGHTFVTALASNLPASVEAGANLCLELTLNGFAQVKDGAVSANLGANVKICGVVTAYAAATANTLGALKAAGRTFVTALDADLPASVQPGADLCLDLNLNGFAQVKNGTAVANLESTLDVCGQVTAYAAASPSSDGILTIAGVPRKIRAGADVDGGIGVGSYLKLRLTSDVFARIAKVSILKAGVSLADACGDSPAPTQNPGSSQNPGQSNDPGSSQDPGQSPDPGSSQDPGQSQEPGSSSGPGSSGGPGSSTPPTGNVDGNGETCADAGVGGLSDNQDGGTLLPSTDALGRATGIIASNAIPLLAIGLLGGFAAWYRSRRRTDEYALAEGADAADADPTDMSQTGSDPGIADAGLSNTSIASGHDGASEDRS